MQTPCITMKVPSMQLLPKIVLNSPESASSDSSELDQNMLDTDDKMDLGPAANSRNKLRYILYHRLPTDRVQRR